MKLPFILVGVIALTASVPLHGQVVINEIMYNTPSANPAEEWIELHNRGTTAVNLLGWRISDGVDYTFGNVTIPAGGYLEKCFAAIEERHRALPANERGVVDAVVRWPT